MVLCPVPVISLLTGQFVWDERDERLTRDVCGDQIKGSGLVRAEGSGSCFYWAPPSVLCAAALTWLLLD